jgi:hypothetical protein
LILAADPTAALGAATKQYLDNRAVRYDAAQGLSAAQQIQARQNIYVSPFDAMGNNNIALNGAMDVNQFTPGGLLNLSSGASVYAVDQWLTSFTNATAAFQAQKISPPGSPPFGLAFPACLQLKATTAMLSLGTNDIALLYQNFEGYRIAKLGCGSASGTGVAIGFWVYATVAGTGALSISNPNGTRCYLADFTVTSPATWQWVTIIVPPETSGSWVTTNAVAWYPFLTFAVGPGSRGASGWNAGNFLGTSATTNFFASAGNVVCITGVVILPGAEAPSAARSPLLMRPTPEELKLCQRYYWSDYNYGTALGTADSLGTNAIATGTARLLSPGYFPVEMRVAPSITVWDPAATNVTNAVRSAGNTQIPLTTPTPNGASTKTPWRVLTVAGTPPFTVGQDYWFHLTADARL